MNLKYESVTICHQLKRKSDLWECEDYLSSEKIYIYLQESLGQWLLIVQRDTGYGLSKEILWNRMEEFTSLLI